MTLEMAMLVHRVLREACSPITRLYSACSSYATRSPKGSEPSFIAEESFVRAPLNSRVVSGAGVPAGKGKGKQERLDIMPLDIQEAAILEDLLFVLMVGRLPRNASQTLFPTLIQQGIEGTHITYHEDYSPEDDDPLEGTKFSVSKHLGMSHPLST